VAVCACALHAEAISIGSARDNTLFEDPLGETSNGAGQYFFIGRTMFDMVRRGLIEFDVAGAIPAGSTINSVALTLHMSRTATAGELASLHEASAEWGESTSDAFGEEGTGTFAEPGDATWLHTFYSTTFWSQPGGDFDPFPSAEELIIGIGFYTFDSTPDLVDDVQGWLDDPASNHGWMLRGNEDSILTAKRFDTREHPDPSMRPVLTIEYTPIPEPSCIVLFFLAATLICGRRSGHNANERSRTDVCS
jgi:hypothetical protein